MKIIFTGNEGQISVMSCTLLPRDINVNTCISSVALVFFSYQGVGCGLSY
jgi:hypothetical protein